MCSMDPELLRKVIAQAQAGEAQGFEQLLLAYGPRLYGYLVRATGSHHDAEDLLSELMLRLVRMIRKYDDRGKFEPWLFRIASNMVRDRIRRRTASPISGSLSLDSGGPHPLSDELQAQVAAAGASLEMAEATEQLRMAMEKLDPTTREMILLRHFGDMSFKEIAQLYKCPLGTALARVHRGLKTLRRLMGDDNDE